jgi:hypothetical protein
MKKITSTLPHSLTRSLLLLLSLTLAGCGSGGGSSAGGTDDTGDSGAALEPTLSSIQENIFTPTCARSGCHSSASASAGLSLADGESFDNLVNIASTQAAGLNRVTPFDANNSYLIHKLEGTQVSAGGSGTQMPQGDSPLSDEEIDAIVQWIEDGAGDN